jgi:hypothetical protein
MNRDVHASQLGEVEYGFALNANTGSEKGDAGMVQNEPSNVLCRGLDGWKVCGYKQDTDAGVTYFFLSEPETGKSRIVSLRTVDYLEGTPDEQIQCGCDFKRLLGERMEESEERYMPVCGSFETVLEDCTEDESGEANTCLGFDVYAPVHDIVIKYEKCGKRMYWAQKGKPVRYLDFGKAKNSDSEYYFKRKPLCGESDQVGERTCLNCDRLRVFPLLSVPRLEVEAISFGGNLRAGVYEFLIAYCDQSGMETSSYYSLTNQVPVFDAANVAVEGNNYGRETPYGIRLRVSGLDAQAPFYKIAVIQTADTNHTALYFIEGIHPVTEETVYLTASAMPGNYREGDYFGTYRMTTLTHLSTEKTVYRTAAGMTSSGKSLFLYGLEAEEEWNLQPVANLLGSLLWWRRDWGMTCTGIRMTANGMCGFRIFRTTICGKIRISGRVGKI